MTETYGHPRNRVVTIALDQVGWYNLDVGCVLGVVAVGRGWVRGSRVVEACRPSFCCCTVGCDNGHEACPEQDRHEVICRIVGER